MNTLTTLIIRHVAGSKKGEVEKFPVNARINLRVGRGPNNDISFDPVKEDTISREHCRIVQDEINTDEYLVIDCQSKNGTYVNDRLITEKTKVTAGDIIKLGKEGPVLEFDLDPRPASHVKKTRVIDSGKETKMHDAGTAMQTTEKTAPQKDAIGKQTMQHMLQQSEKKGKKGLLITIIAFVLLAGTAGFLLYQQKGKTEIIHVTDPKTTKTPTEVAKENEDKVVYIEMGWKLTKTNTGEELYMVYYPLKQGGQVTYRGAYYKNQQGKIVPYLTTKSNAPANTILDLVGSAGSGSGFVIDDRGFVITNRHVASNWFTSFHFQEYAFPGVLLEADQNGRLKVNTDYLISSQDVGGWVPGNEEGSSGVNTYLDVTFANNSQRTPAKIVRISSTHDVAMIKIDLPESLPKVTMYDSYKEIQPGDATIVMGYPGIAPAQLILKRSQDVFNTNPNITTVPVPTVSNGNVGRMVRGTEKNNKIDDYMSTFGDYYQLTINSTGGGNSGGPMFDDKGRVVGIFSAGKWEPGASISFAVPIKYAIELMGRQEVIK
ncbi:MAG: trypsin-like peptidase domain-containing protein [Panacibacter sp.]